MADSGLGLEPDWTPPPWDEDAAMPGHVTWSRPPDHRLIIARRPPVRAVEVNSTNAQESWHLSRRRAPAFA